MRQPDWATEDGRVKLYCCDQSDVTPGISRDCAIVTDPPYGIFACGGKWGHKSDLQWDKRPAFVGDMLDFCECFFWGGNYFALPPSRGWLVWHKRDAVPSAASVELCWTNKDMNARLVDATIAATNPERCGHPTQKPLAVMEFTLSFCNACAVFDPFMGSGTTGVACVRLGRQFIGIEKEPRYFDIAVKRIKAELERAPLFEPKPTYVTRNLFDAT